MKIDVWNKTMECISRDQLFDIQSERLRSVVRRVYQNVPFYRNKMHELGISPQDIKTAEDIHLLPFTTKQDLRDNYPFGMFAVPQSEIVRIHASSGTTGKPTVSGYTSGDIDRWSELMARSFVCAGVTKRDIVQVSYGYGMFTGGLGAHYGAEKLGAAVIPLSGGNTARQIMCIEDFGTTVICCTPSYILNIVDTMQKMDKDFSKLQLKIGIMGAEPWTETMRQHIEDVLGIEALNIYGLSEVMGPAVSMECVYKNGMHIWEDHFIPEIIGANGEVLEYGQRGDLTFTTITKHGMPLIRYRTHDLTSLNVEKCDCGRTHVRMERILGRTDDMLIIRGVNVFPSQIEFAILQVEGVEPHYKIIVDREGLLDNVEVQVELNENMMTDTVRGMEEINRKLVESIAAHALINAKVKLCQPGSLERFDGKASRVVDKRKLQ